MRIISRTDASLAVSLIVAALTLFNQPLKDLLDVIASIEDQYHVAFLPALTVLSAAFAITQSRKSVEAAASARLSHAKVEELERLLSFGNALAQSLEEDALQRTLSQQLPAFFGDREYWLLARRDKTWIEIAHVSSHGAPRSIEAQEQMAEQALLEASLPGNDRHGVELDEVVCFPLMVGPMVIGVLGVHNVPRLSTTNRIASTATVAPLALALRNLSVVQELQQQGIVDQLTGCLNRAAGMTTLQGELRRARRSRRPISVIMIDIDQFKAINDSRGHLAGDVVLETLGAVIGNVLRSTDIRCRFGGDEFLIILPETTLEGAERAAIKLRAAMRSPDVGFESRVTLSIGIAQAERGALDVATLIDLADAAMYIAKQSGGDTFRTATPGDHAPAPRRIHTTAPSRDTQFERESPRLIASSGAPHS